MPWVNVESRAPWSTLPMRPILPAPPSTNMTCMGSMAPSVSMFIDAAAIAASRLGVGTLAVLIASMPDRETLLLLVLALLPPIAAWLAPAGRVAVTMAPLLRHLPWRLVPSTGIVKPPSMAALVLSTARLVVNTCEWALACLQALDPTILLLFRGRKKVEVAMVRPRCVARALIVLSARDVLGQTPLGPNPTAALGCNVAATRCQVSGGGDAVTVPPPLVSWGAFPVFWFFLTLCNARPRTESSWRVQRGVHPAPFSWAPATGSVGHVVGDSVVFAPHVPPMHIP